MAKSSGSSPAPPRAQEPAPDASSPRTLAIDVGGTGIKAAVLDGTASHLSDRVRVETPVGRPPKDIVEAIATLVAPLPAFDRVSVGFPGVVREGMVLTAPNLGNDGWTRFDLAGALSARLGKPVRVLNDADMQGLGAIQGHGFEMVITLGTGFGTGLYMNGRLLPHLEIAHMRFRKGETFDEQLGNAARRRVGRKRWSKRVRRAIARMRRLTNFDHLYIGGGNARRLALKLRDDVTIVSNQAGINGGVRAWRD